MNVPLTAAEAILRFSTRVWPWSVVALQFGRLHSLQLSGGVLRLVHDDGHLVLALALEEAFLYSAEELVLLDLLSVLAWGDDDGAVGTKVVAGLHRRHVQVGVEVRQAVLLVIPVEADPDLAPLIGDVQCRAYVRR
jgi:hypothetical protein